VAAGPQSSVPHEVIPNYGCGAFEKIWKKLSNRYTGKTRLKKKLTAPTSLSIEQIDLSVSFYDMAVDYPRESFAMIAKRVVPKGFGKSKTSARFKQEAKRHFYLARS
jgi:hypothetical protein